MEFRPHSKFSSFFFQLCLMDSRPIYEPPQAAPGCSSASVLCYLGERAYVFWEHRGHPLVTNWITFFTHSYKWLPTPWVFQVKPQQGSKPLEVNISYVHNCVSTSESRSWSNMSNLSQNPQKSWVISSQIIHQVFGGQKTLELVAQHSWKS